MIDYVPFNEQEFYRWVSDLGDRTYRLNYQLDSNSIVVDAGGYLGEWADNINAFYGSTVYVFEPLSDLYNGIKSKFSNNPNIIPYKCAIGNKNCELTISVDTDSSSVFNEESDKKETIQCIDVKTFLEDNNIDTIDLFKINIEGGEYDLLERLIELDIVSKIKNFQIQFHRFIPDCDMRRRNIQSVLSKTHEQNWNYEWIWENWKLKD